MGVVGDFRRGDRVTVRQHDTWRFGRLILKDNTFIGVRIAGRNPDGSYQVKGIIRTPQTDEVTVPADWIEPAWESSPPDSRRVAAFAAFTSAIWRFSARSGVIAFAVTFLLLRIL